MQVSGFADSRHKKPSKAQPLARPAKNRITSPRQGRDYRCRENEIKMQLAVRRHRARRQNSESRRHRKPDRLCKTDGREQHIAVM